MMASEVMLDAFCKFLRKKFHLFPKKISKKKLQRLPIRFYEGEIDLISSPEMAKIACQEILNCDVIGFDTESKPAFSKGEKYPPSLVQIGTEKKVYIFQLAKINHLQFLKPILENHNIKKVGIAIRDDVLKLKDIENFRCAGFIDISDITKSFGIIHTGLRNLAGIFLKFKISKSSQVTDWSLENLSPKQLIYAATDAWTSRELYLKVQEYL